VTSRKHFDKRLSMSSAGGGELTIPWTAATLRLRGSCEGELRVRVADQLLAPVQLLTED
jgi:hypothetical protein